ncbi:TPA: hypothetical protein PXM42_002144 [Yersinia enterocolitica]|nr:hypothetical protein [Yersinia enterocolitica]
MNTKERKKLARAIAHRADSMKDVRLEKNIATALTGCTARVYKATDACIGSQHRAAKHGQYLFA